MKRFGGVGSPKLKGCAFQDALRNKGSPQVLWTALLVRERLLKDTAYKTAHSETYAQILTEGNYEV